MLERITTVKVVRVCMSAVKEHVMYVVVQLDAKTLDSSKRLVCPMLRLTSLRFRHVVFTDHKKWKSTAFGCPLKAQPSGQVFVKIDGMT